MRLASGANPGKISGSVETLRINLVVNGEPPVTYKYDEPGNWEISDHFMDLGGISKSCVDLELFRLVSYIFVVKICASQVFAKPIGGRKFRNSFNRTFHQ